MATENKTWLRDFLLGGQPTTKAQTVANIIGGTLMGGAFLGALDQQGHSFLGTPSVKGTMRQAGAILPAAIARNEEIGKKLTADLAGYEQASVEQAQTGLGARGIGDARVRAETTSNVRAGLSGAYAKAKAALTKARFNAESGLANVVGQYQANVAQKQMDSQMRQYANQLGLWSALTGAGAGLMQLPGKGKKDTASVNYQDYVVDPTAPTAPFRMAGVQDTAPLMLDPRYNARGR
jgi:hypothetical protein